MLFIAYKHISTEDPSDKGRVYWERRTNIISIMNGKIDLAKKYIIKYVNYYYYSLIFRGLLKDLVWEYFII